MSRQLATEIKAFSRWQHFYGFAFLLVTVGVLLTLGRQWQLSWELGFALNWVWIMVIIVLSLLIYVLATIGLRNQPLHLTLCDINAANSNWQLLYLGADRPVLWQAKIRASQNLHHCIVFTFATTHPSIRKKTVIIWQDQVSATIWRQLKILSQ
ncbi:hypothetical protein [Psychrobacter sp. FDAARGOS_221]|uniref:hypothetical protein n=1 Tax=Psychrobacter sp. FDAARGOS_221 TaxID=1975705 RepID=UPI000BB52C70|nr:hypothetical protein [Psychrobacter sp. FDAARGOS_221]PNK60226.1 hypothetical protein A6J60_004630 [Psychrobacter sp. FDAARGOS_221]